MATRLLKPAEVAEELQVDLRTVYRMLNDGDIPCIVLGHRTKRITRQALQAYLAKKAKT